MRSRVHKDDAPSSKPAIDSDMGHATQRGLDAAARWLDELAEPCGKRPSDALSSRDLIEVSRLGIDVLVAELGLEPPTARRLHAAFALGRAVEETRRPARRALRSARCVFELLRPALRGLEQESFWSLLLDGKQRLRRAVQVTTGTLTASLVHPREVYRAAVREAAAAVIVAHNHPSGDAEPSSEDIDVTRRLKEAGDVLGIPLQDHVILGDDGYVSLRERNLL